MTNRIVTATIVAAFVVLSNLLIPAVCLAYEGTDPYTGLNEAQKVWAKDAHINELLAKIEALLANKNPADNATICDILGKMFDYVIAKANEPKTTAPAAQAAGQAQANAAGNAAGDVARDQAIQSIDYASRFLKNFTTEKGNKWNSLRDSIFVPIALLLILPGAVLTQMKCIIAAGSPVVQQTNPLEGIQRAIIAVFLIPGTYLIVNYGIDFANSIQYTIATEYTRLFGTNMYRDAICAEIRAFGVRYISENDGSLNTPPPDQSASSGGTFSPAEAKLWGKLVDPCVGLKRVPRNRDDASMPASAIAARLMMNASNAGINTAWSILCAFQMAFFYYLYFVGPIMAALWVWPMKQLRDAFPSWVEGVVTLCFWSLFWHTTILLMACFKGTDETGLFVMSALNFLATACVKNAFDFAGLVRAAGQKASELIEKGGKGGGGGAGGGDAENPVAQGNGTAQTVTQEQVSAYQGSGAMMNKYADYNHDGKVDGVWNSNTGNYDPLQAGPPIYLVNPTVKGADAAKMDNITLPPGNSAAVVTPDGSVAFQTIDPKTGHPTYEVPKVKNEQTGEMVAKFIVNEKGEVFEFNGREYVKPQVYDREMKMYLDKYHFENGVLKEWTPEGWKPLKGEQPQVVPPPVADPQPAVFRSSVTANMADTYFPVMHYPMSAKLQDADATDEDSEFDCEFENAKANAWELMEFAVQQLKNQETQDPNTMTTEPAEVLVPQTEKDSNMSNKNQSDDVSDLQFGYQKRLDVAPPPLTFSPAENAVKQPLEIDRDSIEAIKQTVPIVSLEAEIEKLFQRMADNTNANTNGLFVSREKDTAYNATAHVSTFAPRTPEELLSGSEESDQKSALSRALGRAFKPATSDSTGQNESLW